MSTTQLAGGVVAAILLFWGVGAYNRLVRLRGAIVRGFGPVDDEIRRRHELLLQTADVLAPLLANAAPRLDALRAACQQVIAACAQAKLRPGSHGAITSLRLADEILAEARARLPVQTAAGIDLSDLNARFSASDAMLAFARGQFNDAVSAYNHAIRQFPTVLLVGLFGFRGAGVL